jgi:hypothetical protein
MSSGLYMKTNKNPPKRVGEFQGDRTMEKEKARQGGLCEIKRANFPADGIGRRSFLTPHDVA